MFNWIVSLGAKKIAVVAAVSAGATGTAVVINQQYPDLLQNIGLYTQPPVVEKVSPKIPKKAEEKTEIAKLSEPKSKEPVEQPVKPAIVPPKIPTFDIMRVEKDGSMLVAGAAEHDLIAVARQ